MAKAQKSNEYDIRHAVVSRLLTEGIHRSMIRLEIPLDTASSGGRADVVTLSPHMIACIELKSGKDKYCPEAITKQCEAYNHAFDACFTVVDLCHKREITDIVKGRDYGGGHRDKDYEIKRDNWRPVNFQYHHDERALRDSYGDSFNLRQYITQPWRRSYLTSASYMMRLMWASEIRHAFGYNTRSKFFEIAREVMPLREIRTAVVGALQNRPLNSWEAAFWKRFDVEAGHG